MAGQRLVVWNLLSFVHLLTPLTLATQPKGTTLDILLHTRKPIGQILTP
jgi:hypothetical protein